MEKQRLVVPMSLRHVREPTCSWYRFQYSVTCAIPTHHTTPAGRAGPCLRMMESGS